MKKAALCSIVLGLAACGGTTADVVARWLGERVQIEPDPISMIAPPRYEIEGVELVTEGAVTLNQACNLVDVELSQLREDNSVTELCRVLREADCIQILHGQARNTEMDMLCFRQQGVLPRAQILPLIVAKLKQSGKLVTLQGV